jgi:hypothetical protein
VKRHPGARSDRGSMAVELVGFVPLLALITLLLVQGFLAATAVTSAMQAARDGARAWSLGRDVQLAVDAQLPSWVRLQDVDQYSCDGECLGVAVEVRIPIGIPGITVQDLTVTRHAEFPRG